MNEITGTFDNLDELDAAAAAPDALAFKSETLLPAISFLTQNVPPPSPLYVAQGEALRVIVLPTLGFFGGIGFARLLKPDGTIQPYQINISVPSPVPASVQFDVPLSEGFLLDVAVGIFTGAEIKRGQMFVIIGIIRGSGANALWAQTLVQDYVSTQQAIGWPGSATRSTLDGAGFLHIVSSTIPAAGADASMAVPTGIRRRVYSVNALLTTSAAVANRSAELDLSSGGISWWRLGPSAVQAASLTKRYVFAPGAPLAADAAGVQVQPLPNPLFMSALDVMATATAGLQAGDQWTALQAHVEDWIEP